MTTTHKKSSNYIPMTSTNTTSTPEDQDPVMKVVVGGSAADILNAMQKVKRQKTYN